MKFIRDNSYDIFKLMLNQLGLAVFGLIMSSFLYNNNSVFIATGVLSVLLYLYVIYAMIYEVGQKDKPAVDAGRKPATPFRGTLITLCANSINIILALIIIISSFFLVKNPDYNAEAAKKALDSQETTEQVETDDNQTEDNTETEADTFKAREEIETEYLPNTAASFYGVATVIAAFIEGMYTALKTTFFADSNWIYLAMPIPAILVGTLAYNGGVRGKGSFLIPKEKRRRQ